VMLVVVAAMAGSLMATPPAHAGQGGPPAHAGQPGPPAHAGPPAHVTPGGPPAHVTPGGPPANVPPAQQPVTPGPQQPEGPLPAVVNVIHGIPALGVTVCVNGEAAIPMFDYKDVVTVPLPAGEYDLAVFAGYGTACTGTPALSLMDEDLEAGVNYTVIAHKKVDGTNALTAFVNNTGTVRPGTARVVLHHTAQAGAVAARIGRPTPSAQDVATDPFINVLETGAALVTLQLRPGNWEAQIFDEEGDPVIPAAVPAPIQLSPHTLFLVYAVGTPTDGFDLITLTVGL
jgi:hypothetical protein